MERNINRNFFSDEDLDYMTEKYQRIARAPKPKFIRFGRAGAKFIRFGRSGAKTWVSDSDIEETGQKPQILFPSVFHSPFFPSNNFIMQNAFLSAARTWMTKWHEGF